jgi:2-oxoglutarate/2-oxoacid ferredoxin oxidoreductase subunit beta
MSSERETAGTPAPRETASATTANRVGLTVKEYGGLKSTLCVGCGHDVITRQITQAIYEMSIPPYKIAKMSGIGCSSKTTAYFADRGHGFNAVHGRMPSVATGAMMVNPTLVSVGVSGDGDTASIGAGQFVHLLRRNVPMVYIVENNGVYGLTKGQFSATADVGTRLKTGVVNDLPSIDLCAMAIELGCGYVARSFSGDMKQLVGLLKGALAHRGTALLDVISPCVTFNNHESSTKSYKWAKEHEIPIQEIGFIPYYEEITVEYDPGTTQEIALHDGSRIRLKKLRADYDATDKRAALALCQESQEKTEFLTGLIYAEPTKKDFLELSAVGPKPIVEFSDESLRPPKATLDAIMESLK